MEKYTGKSIFSGVAIGPVLYYGKKEEQVKRYKVEDTAAEIERYDKARQQAIECGHF